MAGILDLGSIFAPQTETGLLDPRQAAASGLFAGLSQMGAQLAAAGAPRVGQPGPGWGAGIGAAGQAFSQAYNQGSQDYYRNGMMQRQIATQNRRSRILGDTPDDQLTPSELQARQSIPESLRGVARGGLLDDAALSSALSTAATNRTRPMTAQEVAAAGLRPGTVAYVNELTGAPSVVQQSDEMTPGALQQRLLLARASHAPQPRVTWTDVRDDAGTLIGQRASTGQFNPINTPPMTAGNAVNIVAQLGPRVASGEIRPGSPQFNQYSSAYAVASEPRTEWVDNPQAPGQMMMVRVPRQIPPQYPNPLGGPPNAPSPVAAPTAAAVPVEGAAPVAAAPGAAPAVAPAAAPSLLQGAQPPAPAGAGGAVPAPGAAPTVLSRTSPGHEPSAEERLASGYAGRMIEASRTMQRAVEAGFQQGNMRDALAANSGTLGNFLMSREGQQYRQAQEDWVRAKLRRESGAVIGREEMDQEIRTYFPRPGDSAEVIAQKEQAREIANRAMITAAGRGWTGGLNTPSPAAPRSGGGGATVTPPPSGYTRVR